MIKIDGVDYDINFESYQISKSSTIFILNDYVKTPYNGMQKYFINASGSITFLTLTGEFENPKALYHWYKKMPQNEKQKKIFKEQNAVFMLYLQKIITLEEREIEYQKLINEFQLCDDELEGQLNLF